MNVVWPGDVLHVHDDQRGLGRIEIVENVLAAAPQPVTADG